MAAISWGIFTVRYRSNATIQNLNLAFTSIFLTLAFVEGMLRFFPTVFGQGFANGVLNKYHTGAEGIYYFDPRLRMNFMKPNFQTDKMYYFGYTWNHQTDQHGFRNFRTVTNAEVVLLGDSLIYGHGVDIKQTVGYFIEAISGRTVFNLARQGDCSLQQAYLLTEYMERFGKPKYVVYFFYEKDIDDLYAYRTDAELQEYINTPISEIRYERQMDPQTAMQAQGAGNLPSLYNFIKQLYLVRTIHWIRFVRDQGKGAGPTHVDEQHDPNNAESIGWRYTKHAIEYMRRLSQIHGSQFFIAPLTLTNRKHFEILKNFAREQSLGFIDTHAIDNADKSLFLPVDGHFNEKGARLLAQIVVDHLKGAAESVRDSSRKQ